MAPARAPLLPALLLLLLLAAAVQRCPAQHWSHGWYPGGKRDLARPPGPQVPDPWRPRGAPGCAPRPPPPQGPELLEPPRRPWRRRM